MGKIRWYKRDPDAALAGMMRLTLEQRGAYNTVLDLIYSMAGALPDDDHFIAGWCHCDMRVWKRIKTVLLETGKIYLKDGCIRNSRADVEVLDALGRVLSAKDAGHASARSRAGKSDGESSGSNGLGGTDVGTSVERPFQLPTPTPTPTPIEDKETPSDEGEKKAAADASLPAVAGPSAADAVAIWNEVSDGVLPRVAKLTQARRQSLKRRLVDDCRSDIEQWRRYCQRIRASPFCCGENERGWIADFDFALRAGTWVKVTEGKYDKRNGVDTRPSILGMNRSIKARIREQAADDDDEQPRALCRLLNETPAGSA